MRDGYLNDFDVESLGRQAVDLLYPDATVRVEAVDLASYRWGGLANQRFDPRRVVVTISPDSQARLAVDPIWTRVKALANLIEELAQACREHFRGQWFPPCHDHDHDHGHRSRVTIDGGDVVLVCPSTDQAVARLTPDLPA